MVKSGGRHGEEGELGWTQLLSANKAKIFQDSKAFSIGELDFPTMSRGFIYIKGILS